ncbi:hypothetical protein BJ878DRAFT_545941 [Calycina marina]|uniref:Uncharacterized protein n=1 Tax=Calycina marina TaxID=1763456 RepID=A0A9P8CBM9_9HELO|nr:hypothetical protein BJ878DRAFT_545941 [Calycina marina]
MRSPENASVNMDRNFEKHGSPPSRRSVKAMKSLLSLRLTSPRLLSTQPQSPSPSPSQKSAVDTPLTPTSLHPLPLQILQRRAETDAATSIRSPLKLRPEKYRNARYFPSSPPFPAEEFCLRCSPTGLSCDESCIFEDYASLDDEDFDSSSDSENDDYSCGLGLHLRESARARHNTYSSDLSIKCRGDRGSTRKPLFVNEGAWLSSSSPTSPWTSKRLPPLPLKHTSVDVDREGWLGDTSSEEEGDELVSLATTPPSVSHLQAQGCATALTFTTPLIPAKAQVIDVSQYPMSPTMSIPLRSSSLLDAGRKSRMDFRNTAVAYVNWPPKMQLEPEIPIQFNHPVHRSVPGFDLAMTSPPLSPAGDSGWPMSQEPPLHPRTSSHEAVGGHSYHSQSASVEQPDTALKSIISSLEDSMANFPSEMLLPDAQCIPPMRSHLYHASASQQQPPVPSFPERVEWRPGRILHRILHARSNPDLHRSTSLSTISTFQTVAPPRPKYLDVHYSPQYQLPPIPHFSITNSDKRLHTIFPNSTLFLRAATYSHILAYTFLVGLTSPKLDPRSANFAHVFTTVSHALPSKVVKVLGAPPMTARPARVDIRDGEVVLKEGTDGVPMDRIELLIGRLKVCLGWLVAEMESPISTIENIELREEEEAVDAFMLRALVEVIRGCEQDLSVYV